MPNLTANLQLNLQYTGPDSDTVSMPTLYTSAPYQAQTHGTIDVPDATASATVYAVPFGAIAVDATCGVIENLTGQPLLLKINGAAAASQSIPTGGSFCWANPAVAGSTPITAMSLTTTAIQSGAGRIVYHLFGDPT